MLHPIPILKDNYVWALSSEDGVILVDPGESAPVFDWLNQNSQTLKAILITHHHQDHIGGVAELRNKTGCLVYGNQLDKHRLPHLTHALDLVSDRQTEIEIGGVHFLVWMIPGHTRGHCCYYAPSKDLLFCGDTLFSMGCGRLFEGSPKDMFLSLASIKSLPLDTLICCTHEYTLSNLNFALHLNPHNPDLLQKKLEVQAQRNLNQPSLPAVLKSEISLNPFLLAKTAEELARIRSLKDIF